MAQSTLSLVVSDMVNLMQRKLYAEWIRWNFSMECKMYFYQKYKIPGVVGCVDGTRIYFNKPLENEHVYINRKGKHSLNVMMICNHEMEIMAINAKFPGNTHDSYVWRHSTEKAYFENFWATTPNNTWLLGDSGYPLEPWLMTPYRNPVEVVKIKYNDVHSKAKCIIERCIGVYKGRWRILLQERKSKYQPKKWACL